VIRFSLQLTFKHWSFDVEIALPALYRLWRSSGKNHGLSSLALLSAALIALSSFSATAQDDYDAQVQEMYVAYYGRPADPAGLEWWSGKLNDASGNLSEIIESFGASDEYQQRFAGSTNEDLVNNIFLQVLGRDADAAGLDFYVGKINSGDMTLATLALNVANGIEDGSSDDAIFRNKLEVADAYTQAVDEGQFSYTDIDSAKRILDDVDGSEASRTAALSIIETIVGAETEVEQYFVENVQQQVLQPACLNCHIEEGLSGHTNLVFNNTGETGIGGEQTTYNIAVFKGYLTSVDNDESVILNKVQGISHGGGTQFSSISSEYQALTTFLNLLTGNVSNEVVLSEFWSGIGLADARQTLRRAAIIIAGRLPSDAEYAQAEMNDEGLRQALASLMESSGEGFHNFLIRSANDRLLTDAFLESLKFEALDVRDGFYPELTNASYDNLAEGGTQSDFFDWFSKVSYGVTRAPLELIAYVVEQDLPYTEILTADYMMVNPQSAEILRANIQFDSDDPTIFKPGKNNGQIFRDEEWVHENNDEFGVRINAHSGFFENYPHAGVLNTQAFLNRYPTTETNRNRARARWTLYHFLDLDIEKSASRTTDPEALADTDNPTMNNAACTVCHAIHDPVAGVFQNYGNEGRYRSSAGGHDALPRTYKQSDLYQSGDTWYADMLKPGIDGKEALDNTNSMQWLAQEIIDDSRFSSATIKFWWPGLMGQEALEAPENSSDVNFSALLDAYEAQQETISQLASDFAKNFQVKALLIDMIMSPWFRVSTSASTIDGERKISLDNIGAGRLLTPRELENKSYHLLGFRWGEAETWRSPEGYTTHLGNTFRIDYGGIDSNGITERMRQMTAIMSNTAQAQALAMACPAVVLDFNRNEADKILFSGIDRTVTPTSSGGPDLLKEKLQALHSSLLGEELALDSTELTESYDLLVTLWQDRQSRNATKRAWNVSDEFACKFPEGGESYSISSDEAEDPNYMLGTWITMLVYFMTDFSYLHE